MDSLAVLIRGTGDIASAVAHALYGAGHRVAMHDAADSLSQRRRMAFSDALYDGEATLEGVTARFCREAQDLVGGLTRRTFVPVTALGLDTIRCAFSWDVLIDARMRKRDRPEPQLGWAPLTIGLGPGFVAGETVTAAVETSWEDLGRVILTGPTLPLRGEPRPLGGAGRERYVYAPAAGRFTSERNIGDPVATGDVIGHIDGLPLTAPLAGAIRGLLRDGVTVRAGAKVIEIDPRGPSAVEAGIGERPWRIAAGVLAAIAHVTR